MNNNNIERIVDRVSTETYRAKSYSREYDYINKAIIEKEALPALRTILIQELGELNIKYSQLEAKCFAYEAIIRNSNFMPILNATRENSSEAADGPIPTICKDCNLKAYESGFDAGYEAGKKDFDLNTKIAAAEAESEGHKDD